MTSIPYLLLVAALAPLAVVSAANAKVEVYDNSPDYFGGHLGGPNSRLHAHIAHAHKRHPAHDPFLYPPPFLKRKRKFVPPPPPAIERRVPKGHEQAPPSAPTSYVLEVRPGKKPQWRQVKARHAALLRHHMKRRRRQVRKMRAMRRKALRERGPFHAPRLPVFEKPRFGKKHTWGGVYDNDYDFNEAGDELDDD